MSSKEELDSIDYKIPGMRRSRWITYLVVCFITGLFLYFPITYKVKSIIKSGLNSIPGCSIEYKDLTFEYFLPKVIVNDLNIPKRCFGQSGEPLAIDNTKIYFRGFSFSPFGPHFKVEASVFDTKISTYITAGIGGVAVNIKENIIELSKIQSILPIVKLAGKVKVDAILKLKGNKISDLKIHIRSKDFILPGQSISAFTLATMRLNDFLVKAEMVNSKLKITNMILGDSEAPIRANFKGDIKLNTKNIRSSNLNLKGEVAFSEGFLNKYSIIKLLMNKFDKKDEFYQIQIKGPLSSPTPSSPRQ